MRETKIVGDFGEYFTAISFANLGGGYLVDIIDSNGIDLMCYSQDERRETYGVSVKSRNVARAPNSSILLRDKDIVYCRDQARDRQAIPCLSFVVMDRDKLDIIIVTLEGLLHSKGCSVDEFDKDNLSVGISAAIRSNWSTQFSEDSIILCKSYLLSEH